MKNCILFMAIGLLVLEQLKGDVNDSVKVK